MTLTSFDIKKAFWPLTWLITLLLLYGAWWSYVRFGYTSDGFHVYSAMRNFVEGIGSWGLWEGPTFEHKMGNHSFLVMFLMLPLVFIFRHPFVLVILSAMAHLVATRFIFNWAKVQFEGVTAVLFGLLYLFFLSGFVFYTGSHSLFIPEVLLPMALLSMVYSLQRKSAAGFLGSYFFLLLIKEEFFLTSPAMIVWAAVLDIYFIKSGLFRTKKFWLQVLGVYAIGFALSVGSTVYYRHLNQFNHAHLQVEFGFVLHPIRNIDAWKQCFDVIRRLLTPILPLLLLAFWFGNKSARWFLAFTIFAFPVMRSAGNLILYHVTRDISHWTYVVIAPTVFVAVLECLKSKKVPQKVLIATVALSLVVALRYDRGVFSYTFFRDWVRGEAVLAQNEPKRVVFGRIYQEVLEKIGPNPGGRMAIAVPEYFIWPFMDRSHVSIEWLLDNGKFSAPWVQDYIRHIIIPKDRPVKPDDQKVLDARYELIAEPEGHRLYALRAFKK